MEISITRALAELKLLDKRIEDKISSVQLIALKKKTEKKIGNTCTVTDFNETSKANHTSIKDLISRRSLIKTLIVKSNAATEVKIGEETMSVADAIERKTSIYYDKLLLDRMLRQYNTILADVSRRNEAVEINLDKQINSMLGSGNDRKGEGVEAFSKAYRDQNEWEVVDPLNLQVQIESLKESIEDFESNVDFALSESNSITKITIQE